MTDAPETGWLIHKAGRGWYRPNAQGYTAHPHEAGRYSYKDALSYSHPNGWDGPRDGIIIKHESELPPAQGFIPRADAELAMAEAFRRAAEAVESIPRRKEPIGGQTASYVDLAETVLTILTLAPADALAEVQRLRARVTSLSEQVDTIAEQRDAALARVEKLREAAARVHDSYWYSTDGVILGMYDLGEALRYAALDEDARHG